MFVKLSDILCYYTRFLEWMKTGSNPAELNWFRRQTVKVVLSFSAICTVKRLVYLATVNLHYIENLKPLHIKYIKDNNIQNDKALEIRNHKKRIM